VSITDNAIEREFQFGLLRLTQHSWGTKKDTDHSTLH
jgi:hypothetical protein